MSVIRDNNYLVLILYALTCLACVEHYPGRKTETGIYYRVQEGESLKSIADKHHVTVQRLTEANRVRMSDNLAEGAILFIPNGKDIPSDRSSPDNRGEHSKKSSTKPGYQDTMAMPTGEVNSKTDGIAGKKMISGNKKEGSVEIVEPNLLPNNAVPSRQDYDNKNGNIPNIFHERKVRQNKTGDTPSDDKKNTRNSKYNFRVPVDGKVISQFGKQPNGLFFNGIAIRAREGSAVTASAEGIVIFSDNHPLTDYGETVMIKHDNDYVTVYANITMRIVKKDDLVKQGQRIASILKSEAKNDSVMYFEIRYRNRAVNPLSFISGS